MATNKNLNNMVVTPPTKTREGHSSTSPGANEGKDWHAKNETKEYVSPSTSVGAKGGKNTGGG